MRTWLGLAAGIVLATPASPQQLPTFRSGVDIVRLDVSVLDKDRRPVRGLTAADFTITVDGTPQPIVAFDAVVLPPRETPTAPWMRDVASDVKTNALSEPRLFTIIMDDAQTPVDPYMVNNARTLVASRLGDSTPERGGRAKRFFKLRPAGLKALRESRAMFLGLWRDYESVLDRG